MAKTTADFQSALQKVQAIKEESWSKEQYAVELTRALTAVENARQEWNLARQKLPLLHEQKNTASPGRTPLTGGPVPFADLPLGQLCKIGFALTWPLLVVASAALVIFLMLLQHH